MKPKPIFSFTPEQILARKNLSELISEKIKSNSITPEMFICLTRDEKLRAIYNKLIQIENTTTNQRA